MIILTHGDLRPRRFICDNCGSEFIADCSEYSHKVICSEKHLNVNCPECHYSNYVPVASCCYQLPPKQCISCCSLTHCIAMIDAAKPVYPSCPSFENLNEWRSKNAKSI